jgi:hypothetical protein
MSAAKEICCPFCGFKMRRDFERESDFSRSTLGKGNVVRWRRSD